MSWFSKNVTVIGAPVNGRVSIQLPLPGMDKAVVSNLRTTVVNMEVLDQENAQPAPTQDAFYPILSSMNW